MEAMHVDAGSESAGRLPVLEAGNLRLDLNTYRLSVDGEPIDLTYHELEVLRLFLEHPDTILPYDQITGAVWQRQDQRGKRYLNVLVHRLRSKLGASWPYLIETVRGRGYGLVKSRSLENSNGSTA